MSKQITIEDLGLTISDVETLVELAKCIRGVIKTDSGNVIVFKDNTVLASEKSMGIISNNNIVISSGNTLHLNPDRKQKINKMLLEDTNVLNNNELLLEKSIEYKENDMFNLPIKVLDYNLRDGYTFVAKHNLYSQTKDSLMVLLIVNFGDKIDAIEVPLYNTDNIDKWRNLKTDKPKPELEIIEKLGLPKPGYTATIKVRFGLRLIKNDIREFFTGKKSITSLDKALSQSLHQPVLFDVWRDGDE